MSTQIFFVDDCFTDTNGNVRSSPLIRVKGSGHWELIAAYGRIGNDERIQDIGGTAYTWAAYNATRRDEPRRVDPIRDAVRDFDNAARAARMR